MNVGMFCNEGVISSKEDHPGRARKTSPAVSPSAALSSADRLSSISSLPKPVEHLMARSSVLREALGSMFVKGVVTASVLLAVHIECQQNHQSCRPQTPIFAVMTAVAVLIPSFAIPTRGFYNTALAVGAFAVGKLPIKDTIIICTAQAVGVISAMTLLRHLAPEHLHEFVRPPSSPLLPIYAAGVELVCTFASVLLALSADAIPEPLRIPTVVATVLLLIYSGNTPMDPSGALAGAYFASEYESLVEVYVIPSIIGSILAGVTHSALQEPSEVNAYLAQNKDFEIALTAAVQSAIEVKPEDPMRHVAERLVNASQRFNLVKLGRARRSLSSRSSNGNISASLSSVSLD